MRKVKGLDRTVLRGPYILVSTNEEEYKSSYRALNPKLHIPPWLTDSLAEVHTLYSNSRTSQNKLCCIVTFRFPKRKDKLEETMTCVHEAVHVWQAYTKHIGDDQPGDEIEAYSIENIAKTITEEYWKRRGFR